MDGDHNLDIAVIGVSCEFGSAADIRQYWEAIAGAHTLIRTMDSAELRARGAPPEGQHGMMCRMAALGDIAAFDHRRFGVPARDAEIADPQLRLMFKHSSLALASAGCDPALHEGRIGLFGSASTSSEWANQVRASQKEQALTLHEMSYVDRDFYMTRLAYGLGLTGPAVLVNTACSSSLVVVHAAIQSLLAGDCDIALAGACSLRPFWGGYPVQEGGIFSPTGSCMPFSADADGTVPGEGAAFLVLKPLDAALEAGDRIFCIVKGSAVNNDGDDKPGYAAPSAAGQAAVVGAALAASGIAPSQLAYVECHGTGTRLGDPVEIAALDRALRRWGKSDPLHIGSAKAAIGHTDVVVGIAGLIKAALILRHRTIPPQRMAGGLNPLCKFPETLFRLAGQPLALQAGVPHCIGISSFGVGGTNAHAVISAGSADFSLDLPEPATAALPRFDRILLQRHLQQDEPASAAPPQARPGGVPDEPELLAGIIDIMRQHAGSGEIQPGTRLRDLGIDSIAVLMITEDLQARFGRTPTPAQFVELKTVSDLALAMRAPAGSAAAAGGPQPEDIPGESPLAFGQRRFFYPHVANPLTESYAAVFRLGEGVAPHAVKGAVARTILHHQALRSRFVQDVEGQWRVHYGDYPADGYFSVVQRENCAKFDAEAYCRDALGAIEFTRAPLFFAHMVRFADGPPLLILFSHHVIYDGYSLNIVFQDLLTHFKAGSSGPPPATPVSLYVAAQRDWYRRLDQQAQHAYWSKPEWRACRQLPVDMADRGVGGLTADEAEHRRTFDAATSAALVKGLKQRKIAMLDAIIYAVSSFYLGEAGGEWMQLCCPFGGRSETIGTEGQDYSRTVGLLALNGLLLIRQPDGASELEKVMDIKRQLADIPGKGTAYFIEACNPAPGSREKRALMPVYDRQVGVNFFGYEGFDTAAVEAGQPEFLREFQVMPPGLARWYRLDLDFGFANGCFSVGCRYASTQYHAATIARHVDHIAGCLLAVADCG